MTIELPRFFRLRQDFPRPRVNDVETAVASELHRLWSHSNHDGAQTNSTKPNSTQPTSTLPSSTQPELRNKTVAITAGSRGIANIAAILRCTVNFFRDQGALPIIVPAMGSHGGGTAQGQLDVLAHMGISEATMQCPIKSSMEVVEVCQAAEGFPVYFDRVASQCDHVFVVNRIKPHTRFSGDIESGLMKMMLIGLGKKAGAEVYHRAIVNHSFDRIVRSVANTVMDRCNILGGLAILENSYEETAQLTGLLPQEIEAQEPRLLELVKQWMPALPFAACELLIVDQMGKNISGTGMDTNVIGRKRNDKAAIDGDSPDIHHIYVRSLTPESNGNASGIGVAAMCHQRVTQALDRQITFLNSITASHINGASIPVDFGSDREALQVGCQLAGYIPPSQVSAMWIRDTLSLDEVECSEVFYEEATGDERFTILEEPRELSFNSAGDLIERFSH